jgi:outer membrane protein with beta-barrel domain
MLKRFGICLGLATALAAMSAAPAMAQVQGEVGIFAGWVLQDGVSGNSFAVPGVGVFDRIDPKDSFGWGFDVGVLFGEGGEVGFIFSNQPSKLTVGGTSTIEVGDMKVNTYHGYFAYNWGGHDGKVRPYLMGGFGATTYGDVSYTSPAGRTGTISGETRYSSTWGGGVKVYPSPKVGFRAGMRWTPAYIKSDAAGWWCDPYWGCYLVGNAQYANLLDFTGGVTFRF